MPFTYFLLGFKQFPVLYQHACKWTCNLSKNFCFFVDNTSKLTINLVAACAVAIDTRFKFGHYQHRVVSVCVLSAMILRHHSKFGKTIEKIGKCPIKNLNTCICNETLQQLKNYRFSYKRSACSEQASFVVFKSIW